MRLRFNFHVPADHPSLSGHFPGRPIVPGVLLIDRMISALQLATAHRIGVLRQVKFISTLRAEEPVHALCDVEGLGASFELSVQRGGQFLKLVTARVTLKPFEDA